jgi:hypothetical protein
MASENLISRIIFLLSLLGVLYLASAMDFSSSSTAVAASTLASDVTGGASSISDKYEYIPRLFYLKK